MRRTALAAALAALTSGCLLADFSYEQTTTMTGGAMMSMMKVAGVFSKQAREPVRSTVLVKGNRMAHINQFTTQIIDLDKETITEINNQKKTYSVVTFAQMAEAMRQAEAKMKSKREPGQTDITMKSSVKDTGQTKRISGLNAHEVVLTLEMEGKDPKTGENGTFMVVTSDMWIAPQAGYEEVRNFYRRMAEKLKWAPGGGMFTQGNPEISKGMAGLYEEAAKMDGVPVYQVVRMGAKGAADQPQPADGQGQAAPAEQPQQQAEKPSVGSALGRLGGGRFGGFGGFGRKKKQEQPQPEQQPAPQPSSESAQGQRPAVAPGVLMESTTELSGFSTAAVDASKLEVPAGFKQVDSQMLKMMNR